MLDRVIIVNILSLFLILEGKHKIFLQQYDVFYRYFGDVLYRLKKFSSSITSFLRDYFMVIKMDFAICQFLNLSVDMII